RFGIPAGVPGAADIAFQGFASHLRARRLAARHFLKGIFQDQLAMGFVRAGDRKTQAGVIACGTPNLFALERPAERIAIQHQRAGKIALSSFRHPAFTPRKSWSESPNKRADGEGPPSAQGRLATE